MQIKFFDKEGEPIITITTDAPDHWEACQEGHRILGEGTINGADDFDVLEQEYPHLLQ